MPQKLGPLEYLKSMTGSSTTHLQWEKDKKQASRVVDVSVFKGGLGPAFDQFSVALKALNEYTKKLPVVNGRVSLAGLNEAQLAKVREVGKKVEGDLRAKGLKVDGILATYEGICDAKVTNPTDKLTKPAGPTSAVAQKAVWKDLKNNLTVWRRKVQLVAHLDAANFV